MITFEQQYKQILTPLCFHCPERYFAPAHDGIPHVGCCSYSPTFTLFELYQAIKEDKLESFKPYLQYNFIIDDFEFKVPAIVDESFFTLDVSALSDSELEERKLPYSICQFFKKNQGCSLHPALKNATCRSFICPTAEDTLQHDQQQQVEAWVKLIQDEARSFNNKHKAILSERNLTLAENLVEIISYFNTVAFSEKKKGES
ncbi:hypothetical protein [Alkalihalobacterium bogoriense]|uniref:hypothetical protein n=1 Tax=Alkalihalobacterium bogoriense TaxID=246272 RepID=UPI00047E1627|nr:hypothetical protein [Alkalihalobacterium bogoriense]